MLKLTSGLSPEIYSPLCYVVASTDHTSADRIPKDGLRSGRCRVCTIPRSREVTRVCKLCPAFKHLFCVYRQEERLAVYLGTIAFSPKESLDSKGGGESAVWSRAVLALGLGQ